MARTGLPIQTYVNYVKLQLGGGIVTVEVEPLLPDIVDMAFQELKTYITDMETLTLPFQSVIDVSQYNINNIIYIMRGQNSEGLGSIQDIMYIYSRIGTMGHYTLTDYSNTLLAIQNKNAMATDMDFYFDKRNDKLYVYANRTIPATITLAYTPDYKSVEDIIEPFWQNYLKRMAVAMTKETLGRVRGKYQLNSATYNLDADQLLSEAQTELTEIRTFLNANKDTLMPID